MKRSFSLIELIFIIFILGVLAIIAIPRYLTVQENTKRNLVKSFAATLTRTVGPQLWTKSLVSGHNGSISYGKIPDMFEGDLLTIYIDIPEYLDDTSVNFQNCVKSGTAQPFIRKTSEGVLNVFCRDGNATQSPKFVVSEEDTYTFE